MNQLTLPMPERRFDGPDIADSDIPRLTGQLERVFDVMQDGKWWTIRELADTVDCSDQSASARLRDLRKPKFGGFKVERRRWEEMSCPRGYQKDQRFYRLVLTD